jgi:hypothetical protein
MAQNGQDPLSQLGTPATPASSAPADPLAAIGTPAPPAAEQPGVLERSWNSAKSLGSDVVNSVSNLVKPPETPTEAMIHSVGGGNTSGGGTGALAAYRMAKGIVNAAENVIKATPENYKQAVADYNRTVSEFHNGDYRNALSSAVNTGMDASKIVNPLSSGQANDVKALSEGARPGGDLATPLTRQALTAGAALAGGEALAPEEEGAASATRASEAASKVRVNPFRAAIKNPLATPAEVGEAAAQPVAKAGLAAEAPTVSASLRSGIDTATPFGQAKAIYRVVDEAAKTDFKGLYDKLDSAQDEARLAAPGSPEEAKAQLNIKNTQDAIDDAKKIAEKSGVPDIDKRLASADAKYTEAQANKDFNAKILQPNVKGNIAHGDPETIDIDGAIKSLEKFDAPNKYGISRAQQTTLGKDGVFQLKQALYDAKKAGQTAMDARVLRNRIAKIVAASAGVAGAAATGAYELAK